MKSMKFVISILFLTTLIIGCSSNNDEENLVVAEVSVNNSVLFDDTSDFDGDIDGDFTGNGGSTTRTFTWSNAEPTADYNADITATTDGSFKMVVRDANNNSVLDRSLSGASEPDSFSGVTQTGTPGVWSVTISLTNFKGDGSFSLSEGN
ncbi:hypothetical protein ACW6QP_05325 [Salegentibacter sp. HM20]